MVKFFKEYWFGVLVSGMVFFCMLFAVIIAIAPHNDAKMRGFTPCTYKIATDLGQSVKPDFKRLLKVFGNGYGCYFSVITLGAKQYFSGQQNTPWENYIFEPVIPIEDDEEGEPLSQELLDANLLDEDKITDDTLFGDIQENDDEK